MPFNKYLFWSKRHLPAYQYLKIIFQKIYTSHQNYHQIGNEHFSHFFGVMIIVGRITSFSYLIRIRLHCWTLRLSWGIVRYIYVACVLCLCSSLVLLPRANQIPRLPHLTPFRCDLEANECGRVPRVWKTKDNINTDIVSEIALLTSEISAWEALNGNPLIWTQCNPDDPLSWFPHESLKRFLLPLFWELFAQGEGLS